MAAPDSIRERVELVECSADGPELREFYTEVLAPAFPREELVPLDRLTARLLSTSAPSSIVLARDRDGAIVGGMVGEYYPVSRTLLATYIVVRAEHRDAGVGGRLLREVPGRWLARWRPLLAVGEVEHPTLFPGAGPAAVDRLRLYARFPGVWLGLSSYTQPRLQPTCGRVPNMMLLVFYTDPAIVIADGTEPVVDGAALRRFLEEYYTTAEGPDALTDPDVVALLRSAAPEGGLHLVPLGSVLG